MNLTKLPCTSCMQLLNYCRFNHIFKITTRMKPAYLRHLITSHKNTHQKINKYTQNFNKDSFGRKREFGKESRCIEKHASLV